MTHAATAPLQLATATAAKSGSTVTANVSGTVVTVQVARDLSVSAGDVIIVSKAGGGSHAQWFALGRAYTAAPAYVDLEGGAPPAQTVSSGRMLVVPVWTGTYRDGAWQTGRDDLDQGVYGGAGNATGVAFYGFKPWALAGATVTAATVSMTRLVGGNPAAAAATLQKVQANQFNGSAPTLLASTAGPSLTPGQSADVAVPTAWVQDMITGTSGGLGVFDADGTPFARFAGRRTSATAMLLTIDWTR